jgi:hypothetical protein
MEGSILIYIRPNLIEVLELSEILDCFGALNVLIICCGDACNTTTSASSHWADVYSY